MNLFEGVFFLSRAYFYFYIPTLFSICSLLSSPTHRNNTMQHNIYNKWINSNYLGRKVHVGIALKPGITFIHFIVSPCTIFSILEECCVQNKKIYVCAWSATQNLLLTLLLRAWRSFYEGNRCENEGVRACVNVCMCMCVIDR